MKTLIIISHPELKDSGTQSFLRAATKPLPNVEWHPLDLVYPNYQIDVAAEQHRLKQVERIIFQFPLYWYSSPALLKKWEDDVLTRNFTYHDQDGMLAGKQLGIVTTLGTAAKNYVAGGSEHFTISELMKPFQALAEQAGMRFLPPFVVDQFNYMTPEQKARLLFDYQNYVDNPQPDSFTGQQEWLIQRLRARAAATIDEQQQLLLNLTIDQIENNQSELASLKEQIAMIKRGDDE
ncbi:NAD(P)H-dependent oxidoreductase [Lactobacillus sp. Sy-1]|uniref:NAD(P)H-dependent oxidoreductase n=1 Tax=Lactobacillus sp. Sy-1 TaxID=2109645 RepID=UPI001C55F295|nr:NAD(P)H-dependent oxidoreductase [Lactobacillus sp. Sy-1]MBW1605193.1 NAD(P)H-dependent oxidoreductase [Lactobacillus sp. Sy-1]